MARLSKPDLLAAMADQTKAHELNSAAADPLYRRGELYALAEQWNEAKADFAAAIERELQKNGAGNSALVQQARQHLQAIEKAQKD